jgi:hypothetical protein
MTERSLDSEFEIDMNRKHTLSGNYAFDIQIRSKSDGFPLKKCQIEGRISPILETSVEPHTNLQHFSALGEVKLHHLLEYGFGNVRGNTIDCSNNRNDETEPGSELTVNFGMPSKSSPRHGI